MLLKMLIYPRYKIKGNNGSFRTSTFLIWDHMGSQRDALNNPDYNLVVSPAQTKGSLLTPWLCHPTSFNSLQLRSRLKTTLLLVVSGWLHSH